MEAYLFTYGTLMQGFENSFAQKLHHNATFRSTGYFCGQLYDLGHYPAAIFDPNTDSKVHGEIWQLPHFEPLIAELDRYEGIDEANPEYIRKLVPVANADHQILSCWTYLSCQLLQNFRLIPHGDYRKWLNNPSN